MTTLLSNDTFNPVPLTELVSIKYGKDISIKNLSASKKYPVFGANGIIGKHDEYTHKNPQVLISCRGANSGTINISPPFSYITHNSLVLEKKDDNELDTKYLYYALKFTDKSHIVTGSAQPQVTIDNLNELNVPFTKISNQQKIANYLDLQFERILKGATSAQEARIILKKFRQSILTAAITGKLTEYWRIKNEDIETSIALFERIKIQRKVKSKAPKNSVDINELPAIPEKWLYVYFGDIVNDFKYGTSEKSDYFNKGTPVLRIPNVISQKINTSDLKYLPGKGTREEYLVKNGDILIVRSNGSRDLVGKNALIDGLDGDYAYASYLIRIRPVIVVPGFLSILLNSDLGRRQLFSNAKSAAGINNINTQELASMVVPLPSIEEQNEIIKKVNEYFEVANKVEEQIKITEGQVSKLTQAILVKTFSNKYD